MYIDDVKSNLAILESNIEDKLYLGDVSTFSINDGTSSNTSLEINFILGSYKFTYVIIFTKTTIKIVGYVDNKPKMKYDGSFDYEIKNDAFKDSEYILDMIEYHLLKFFGKTITDEYSEVEYNNNVVILEKKMIRSEKMKLVMEKKMKDRQETEEMNYALEDMFMYFLNKPYRSKHEFVFTTSENEDIYIINTVEQLLKKDEFTKYADRNITFIDTNLNEVIIEVILNKIADVYGFKKERFKEVYENYGTPQERKKLEHEVNKKMTTLLALSYE